MDQNFSFIEATLLIELGLISRSMRKKSVMRQIEHFSFKLLPKIHALGSGCSETSDSIEGVLEPTHFLSLSLSLSLSRVHACSCISVACVVLMCSTNLQTCWCGVQSRLLQNYRCDMTKISCDSGFLSSKFLLTSHTPNSNARASRPVSSTRLDIAHPADEKQKVTECANQPTETAQNETLLRADLERLQPLEARHRLESPAVATTRGQTWVGISSGCNRWRPDIAWISSGCNSSNPDMKG